MDTTNFKEHFDSLLIKSEEHLCSLDQFLAERLTQAEINDPQTVIAGIDAVLDSIDRNHENLTANKQHGTSRAAWLQQNLAEQTSSLKENQAAFLIDTITDSMTGAHPTSADENGSFSGLEAVEKVRNLDQALIATTCQAQTELQNAVLGAPDDAIGKSKLMQQAIEGHDSIAFKQIRKIAAVCLMTMAPEKTLDYVSASLFADRGIFSVLTDFAVGSGECNENDGIERLIDRGAAQLKTWLEVTVPHLIDVGLAAISNYVMAHCPIAAPVVAKVVPVVRSLSQMAVIPAIRQGAEKISSLAKTFWQKLKNSSNSIIAKIANTTNNLLSAN